MSPRARLGLALGSLVVAGLLDLACTRAKPNEPVVGAEEACCAKANQTMTKFAACRVGGRCRSSEPIWLRGSIKCSPVEPRCAGGRCCEYVPLYGTPDAVLNWDDGSAPEPAKTPAKAPAEAPAEPEASEAAPVEPATAAPEG